MALKSMTGFGAAEGEWEDFSWAWQVKSVNNKGLHVHLRLPPVLEAHESSFRKLVSAGITRGSVTANLALKRTAGQGGIQINHALLESLTDALKPHLGAAEKPRLDGLLAVPGVVEQEKDLADDTLAGLGAVLKQGLEQALEALQAGRTTEGEAVTKDIAGHLEELERQMEVARSSNGARLSTIRDRIAARLSELLKEIDLDKERLEQEAAQLAVKADVSEELERMTAHLSAAHDLMVEDAPVGRRFDFLAQEMNREATTLTAKAYDMELKQAGLAMKAAIDRLREQIQNVE